MQLSLRADYALRVLIFLGADPDRVVPTQEISLAYGISKHHLVRVMQTLSEHGYVNLHPGRSGGVSLGRSPASIRLGNVVRDAEPNLTLVECFDRKTNTCCIAPVCRLRGLFEESLEAFLTTLNRYTLADLLSRGGREKLAQILVASAAK